VQIFHAGSRRKNGAVVTSGGRVLAVTALGQTVAAARSRAYEAVSKIQFEDCHFRRDIALSAVADNIVGH
jgi:phosphoribosylamine--glycine ligase